MSSSAQAPDAPAGLLAAIFRVGVTAAEVVTKWVAGGADEDDAGKGAD